MVNFIEIYHFSRFLGGPTFFPGGVQLFPGGTNCLFPIETHITCDFPGGGGGGVRTPCPPSGSALDITSYQRISTVSEKSVFPRKHVLMSLGLSYPVYSQATQPRRL